MQVGMIVISRAGRDQQNALVVVATEGDFAFVCDGKERKLARPKRKRKKHLAPTNVILDGAQYATDKQLRATLARLKLSLTKEELDLG